jgi:hypothetical protein
LEKIKEIYIVSLLNPLIYWGGIVLFYPRYGLSAFAVFKCIAFYITALFYINFFIKFLNISLWAFIKQIFAPLIVPCFVLLTLGYFIRPYLPASKSSLNLFITLMTSGLIILFALMIQVFFSGELRERIRVTIFLLKKANKGN